MDNVQSQEPTSAPAVSAQQGTVQLTPEQFQELLARAEANKGIDWLNPEGMKQAAMAAGALTNTVGSTLLNIGMGFLGGFFAGPVKR